MLMFGIGDVNSVEDADSLLLELSKNHLGGIILFENWNVTIMYALGEAEGLS